MERSLVSMATDGACSGNPGPGGWGVVLETERQGKVHRKELCGGDPATTNNRMELTAVIQGFRALHRACAVTVVSDSQYIVNAFTQGWLKKWQANGWRTSKRVSVENQDLWQALLEAAAGHEVTWTWVRGHAGHPLNERADVLAHEGASTIPSAPAVAS